MSLKFNEPKNNFNFIMTNDEAINIINKIYTGQL